MPFNEYVGGAEWQSGGGREGRAVILQQRLQVNCAFAPTDADSDTLHVFNRRHQKRWRQQLELHR